VPSAPQLGGEAPAVQDGHAHVENDQIRQAVGEERQRIGPVRSLVDHVALDLEHCGDGGPDARFIVHHENPALRHRQRPR
jgi:hypothetical protein